MEHFFKAKLSKEGPDRPVHVNEDTCSCQLPSDRERLWKKYGDYRGESVIINWRIFEAISNLKSEFSLNELLIPFPLRDFRL